MKLSIVLVAGFLLAACNNTPLNIKAAGAVNTDTITATLPPAQPPPNFKSATANINGTGIHYVMGGSGEPLLLIHGFGQNWYMWNRLLPELSPRSTYGAFHWFAAFDQDALDNKEFMKHKLKMPLLAMGSEYGRAFLPEHCRLVAEHVTSSIIKGAGHWIVQENTPQIQQDLLGFLLAKE